MADIDHKIDTKGMAQPTAATCWFACYQMLLKKAGKDHSEDTIKTKLEARSIKFQDAYDNGLDGKDWASAAWALGFSPEPRWQFTIDDGWIDRNFGKTVGQKTFLEKLTKGPLWIGRFVGAGKSHAIIARGYDASDDKVVWVNPQCATGNAFDNRSRLHLFIGMIGHPYGAVQTGA